MLLNTRHSCSQLAYLTHSLPRSRSPQFQASKENEKCSPILVCESLQLRIVAQLLVLSIQLLCSSSSSSIQQIDHLLLSLSFSDYSYGNTTTTTTTTTKLWLMGHFCKEGREVTTTSTSRTFLLFMWLMLKVSQIFLDLSLHGEEIVYIAFNLL